MGVPGVRCPKGSSMKVSESRATTCVTITDDDLPGELQFSKDEFHCTEGKDEFVFCKVDRINGCAGSITCDYETKDITAIAGEYYESTKGTLTFKSGRAAAG